MLDRISSQLKFPGTLIFQETSNDETLRALQELNAEIGIAHNIPNTYELKAKTLFKEEFKLVIPKKLLSVPKNNFKSLLLQLREQPYLGYRREDEILAALCLPTGLEAKQFKLKRATENYSSLAEMVEAEIGWAVLASYIAVSEKKNWSFGVPSSALAQRRFSVLNRPEFSSLVWFNELVTEIQSCFAG